MKRYVTLLFFTLLSVTLIKAQSLTSCGEGEVGVIVTAHTVGNGSQVSWNIQDADGMVYGTNPFTYASNFTYVSQEFCLPEGGTYSFNSFDSGGNGWGSGAWYEVAICGGNTVLINNNGAAPTGAGNQEEFVLPLVQGDECFCFDVVDFDLTSASSGTAADGSISPISYAGTPDFTYEWNNGSTAPSLNAVAPGPYYVTITDANGCEAFGYGEVQGPNIFMMPGSITTCTGYFYDSGGANGDFDSGENYTMVVCSDNPNASTSINFYEFELGGGFWNGPTFTIYDGDTPGSPILYSYDSPTDPAPGLIQASENNATGCLTVVFNSGNNQNDGWFAEINCMYPCQEYTVDFETNDVVNANNEINICYELDLEVVPDFFQNNQGYLQEDITTTFEWDFGDGTTSEGISVNHMYEEGEYELNLTVTDVNGCQLEATYMVEYDHPGIITSMLGPVDNEVCPDTEIEVISGVYLEPDSTLGSFFDPITWYVTEETENLGEDFGDPIYLPDGSGVSYTTTMEVTSFDPLDVLDGNDFQEICIEIEHSYLGDLQMELTAPNGSNVILHSYGSGGGGTWLGDAIDNNSEELAGECWEYCWSIEPEFGTFENSLGNTMTAPINGGASMIPGAYTPEESFANFAGSQANGTWELIITDNLSIDNGFICAWNISMNVVNDTLGSTVVVDSLMPEILMYNWFCQEDPASIVTYDSSHVVVNPTNPGEHNYVMTVLDSYGCEYTEEFLIDVYGPPVTVPDFESECQQSFDISVTDVTPMGGVWEVLNSPLGSTVSFDADTTSLEPVITVSETGQYVFMFTDTECKLSDDLVVDVVVVNPMINEPTTVLCELENTISVTDPTGNGGVWNVISMDTTNTAVLASATALQNAITVSGFGTYQLAYTIDFCHGTDTVNISFESVDPVISDPGLQLCDYDVELEVDNPSPTGGEWVIKSQPNHTSVTTSSLTLDNLQMGVDDFGEYEMLYTIEGCETSDSIIVEFGQGIPQISAEELLRCELVTEVSVETFGLEVGWSQIAGPDIAIITSPLDQETAIVVDQYGDYTLAYTGCDTTVEFNILFMCDLVIPNVFTPNGDNENDLLIIDGLTSEFYSYSNMSIYNRWGDEVYWNGAYGVDGTWWDGQTSHQDDELAEGVYFYVLKVGNKVTEEEDLYRGTVQLFYK